MMRDRLNEALKEATLAKDTCATATIRLILAALKDRDIASRSKDSQAGISDEESLGLLQTMVKQRRESIEMYEKGGREDLAEQSLPVSIRVPLHVGETMLRNRSCLGELLAA